MNVKKVGGTVDVNRNRILQVEGHGEGNVQPSVMENSHGRGVRVGDVLLRLEGRKTERSAPVVQQAVSVERRMEDVVSAELGALIQ